MYPLIARAVTKEEPPLVHRSDPTGLALVAPHVTLEIPVKAGSTYRKAPDVDSGDSATLERIALCESKNDPLAKNSRSSASGRFQFLSSSWEAYGRQLWGTTDGKDVFDYEDNTELAEYVYSKEGGTPWMASYSCWGA